MLQIQAVDAILKRRGEGFETSPAPNRNGSHEDRVMASKALPSPEVLRQLLRYEPDTGKLFWLERPPEIFAESRYSAARLCAIWNTKFCGKEAFGTTDSDGYMVGRVFNTRIRAHRLIWAMVSGDWPDKEIDHIDGNPANNRLENLRLATRSQNEANKGIRSDNTSGAKGVSWVEKDGRWAARIKFEGRQHNLGYFQTRSDAEAAVSAKRREIHGHFARQA